jgi:hypothetical protein
MFREFDSIWKLCEVNAIFFAPLTTPMTFLLTFLELSNIFISPLSYRLIDTETAVFNLYRRNIYSVIGTTAGLLQMFITWRCAAINVIIWLPKNKGLIHNFN